MRASKEFLDFAYIGTPRSGSTWLAAALDQHPGVWIHPLKELNFFNRRCVHPVGGSYGRGLDFYRGLFAVDRGSLSEIHRFLGVDDAFTPTVLGRRVNASRPPRSRWITLFTGAMLKAINTRAMRAPRDLLYGLGLANARYERLIEDEPGIRTARLNPDTRNSLTRLYRSDIQRLEELLETSLPEWRENRGQVGAPRAERTSQRH